MRYTDREYRNSFEVPGDYSTQNSGELEVRLGGESNTVASCHRWASGYGTIVSAYHDGIEYVFQSNDAADTQHEEEIKCVVNSFQF